MGEVSPAFDGRAVHNDETYRDGCTSSEIRYSDARKEGT